jgi:DNA-binding FadR family transcriptional regulator
VSHCPAAARANPSLGEARGGHEEGVELLLEARRAAEPPLTVVRAQRRGAATVSHLGAVPHHVSS